LKKILVIAYFFPPLGGSGVQRALKFVKYLPEFQIQPIVSTVRQGHNFAYDESLLNEIPSIVKIYRSHSLETLWLRAFIEKFAALGREKPGKIPAAAEGEGRKQEDRAEVNKMPENISAQSSGQEKENRKNGLPENKTPGRSLKQRLFNLIDDYLFIPDSKIRWLPCGFLTSLQAARKEKVDFIFSTSYPYTVHLIALLVFKFYRRPWIADFRDPWVGNKAMAKNIAFRRRLDAWLERKVVKNASFIVNVTPPITEMYKERYPEYAFKMITITNGFDEQDFVRLSPVKQQKFTLIYTGIINEVHYDVETFVRGIADFLNRQPAARERFQCLFIGYIPPAVIDIFVRYGIEDILSILPYMDHRECLNYLAGAQLQFLTFGQDLNNAYSGKLFDYIGSEKPVLALLPEGIAAELIRRKQIGSVIPLGQWQELGRELGRNFEAWLAGKIQSPQSASKCAEFSRQNLTGQLVDLLESQSL
jgi:glycosyltransferase involved in cell wall biosynthesis